MADIKIISKQNGVAIVLATKTVFLGDPDGDYIAEAGSLTTQVSIKRDIDSFYVVKDLDYTNIKDSTGAQIGTSRDNCVSVLNSNYFNRTSKIQELDNVDFQNTITAGQVLKFVDIGGGTLRISNETESGGGAANMSQTFSAPSGTGGEFQTGARLVVDAYGTSSAATRGTLSFFGTSAATAVGAQSSAAQATSMLTVVTDAGDSDELLVEGVIRMSSATTTALLPTNTKMGTPVYMSTTAGAVTTTAPSGTGEFVRVVGHVVDATNRTIYFKPDNTWLEL